LEADQNTKKKKISYFQAYIILKKYINIGWLNKIFYTHHNVVILVKETIEKPHGGA
jgi:hypothetical protein